MTLRDMGMTMTMRRTKRDDAGFSTAEEDGQALYDEEDKEDNARQRS